MQERGSRGGALVVVVDMAVTRLLVMMMIHWGLAVGQRQPGVCPYTTSFGCLNGGWCEMIVQGENYTCHCSDQFYGDKCELKGVPCGNKYCLNGGTCVQETTLCDCGSEWNGDETCSVRVRGEGNLGELQQTITIGRNGPRWYTVVFGVLGALIVVALSVATGVLLWRKNEMEKSMMFREMKPNEVQMQPTSGLAPLDNESLISRGQIVSNPDGSSPRASASHV
ncbi:hypothetical protein CBR_g28566 [Chara braunii]|uniref:EGF-like domain-containing protein n=1 Tax=Chara braunii TaxID=69332 RepID=A0A388JWB7_CHABU|nr:hypothetical protein CBR_g28566 [Chara braunii]|eukprot:GBG62090.1 hypothetical protein CBR_g28566 [Chara braunii]